MAQIPILSVLLILWLAGRASADGGDDFANNLASDLGPIIALFGERVVMQFMSQAMGIADCILLAVAPIGAITTVVSAIRVAGPAWLKSFIGRARENISAAEIEIMSSTSNEACELWNGHSVVRCPGSADIYQFICLLPKGSNLESVSRMQYTVRCKELAKPKDKGEGEDCILRKIEITGPRYAWVSFKNVLRHTLGKVGFCYRQLFNFHVSFSLPHFRRRRRRTKVSLNNLDLEPGVDQDEPSVSTQMEVNKSGSATVTYRPSRPRSISESESKKTKSSEGDPGGEKNPNEGEMKEIIVVVDTSDNSSPNLLLNCHDRVHRGEIYLGAAFGVILQVGALVYFGIITYNPPSKGQFFLKDGKRIVDYAFPCAAAGTILLVLGLFICAWVVEKSTTETCYEAPNHQMFVVWLQKDHTVNDQVFKPYAIYPTGKRKYITTSRRRVEQPGQKGDWKLEQVTFFGALIALVGFISQFIGMRGLNWTASVVQLGITFVVTMIRVIVRRGLGKSPLRTPLLSNTELDWFSLTFGDLTTAPWALFEDKSSSVTENVASQEEKPPKWTVRTGGSQPYYSLRPLDSGITEAKEKSAAQTMMVTRQILCKLSRWKSAVSEEATLLSRAIDAVAQTFLREPPATSLVWTLPVSYKGNDENIFIQLKRTQGNWNVNVEKIEAILSLWLYSTPSASDSDTDQPRNLRLYGPVQLRDRLYRDLGWWMPEVSPELFEREGTKGFGREGQCATLKGSNSEGGRSEGEHSGGEHSEEEHSGGGHSEGKHSEGEHSERKPQYVVVGFTSEFQDSTGESVETDTLQEPKAYLVVESEDKRERLFSRDLLFAFIRAVAKMSAVTLESGRNESQMDYSKMTDDWKQLKLKNDTISSLARKLEKIGFGTLSDIYFDLVMPLSLEQKLTNIKDVIDEATKEAQQYERSRQWKNLVDTCSCMLNLSRQFDMDKESSGPLAVAVCVEFLYRLRHEAFLQRQEGRSEEELLTQLKILERKFTSIGKELGNFAGFQGIKHSLGESSGSYATTFDMLIGATLDATRTFPESFNIVDEHEELMQANNSWKTLYWEMEELHEVDSFGWSPLHYAANWQLNDVRIVLYDKGDALNLRDLMGRTPLHHACLKGNNEAVDLLLDRDVPIEVAGNDGVTPIHCAVLSGKVDLVKKLVDKVKSGRRKHTRKSILHVDRNERHPIHWAAMKGDIGLVGLLKDDIDRTDRFGWACIHLAVIYKHKPLLEYILKDSSADQNLHDDHLRTPLHLAIENKSWEAFDMLIRAGADVNVRDKDGSTPLHKAVGRTNIAEPGITQLDIAKRLIERGAEINATDTEGRTALFLSAENGLTAVAGLLIGRKAKVSMAAKDERTALHMAIRFEEITRMLLENGAAIDAKDIEGYTPLYLATMEGTAEVAALLIDHGADVAIAAGDGRTPLHMAIRFKEITRMLLENGAAIDAKDIEGYTPLYLATMEGTAEVAALLIDHGADVAIAAGDGRTPLHMALSRGEYGLEIAKKLLNFDPDMKGRSPYVNAMAEDDATPLHVAAEHGPPEAVEMLLHLGANIDQTDGFGQTALLIAIYNENWDIADFLLDAGANIKADSRVGYTPLLGAVMGDQDRIVGTLLEKDADINAADEDGYSSIHLAVSQGNFTILRHLLSAGANIDAVTKYNNQTPLHIAVRTGNGGMIQILLENGANTAPLNNLEFTPLQYALYRRDVKIVREFVVHDKFSTPTAPKAVLQRGEYGDTPLHTLCRYAKSTYSDDDRTCEMLEELLSVAPNSDMINATNNEGLTPLDLAVSELGGSHNLVKNLKDRGAMPSGKKQIEESLMSDASLDD